MDGGAYITLPQVYTEEPDHPGINRSNLGMYRVQISGNDYSPNLEAGLHYQIQRGIAAHHADALRQRIPLPVNVFVGGAPAMTLAAVMPLPEGFSELRFAGILGRHRIPMFAQKNTLPIYAEADFCLTGYLDREIKPEGPFGDHLGYYSLRHDFPVFRITNIFHRKDAVWPFTVVGRPPQEDSMFGRFIHRLVGNVVTKKLPGVRAVHAVDEAGVHPLLLAIGSERYVPFDPKRRAAELHTLAHAILGFGQLSLAKYLFLAAQEDDPALDVYDTEKFLKHILSRVDWRHDIHFVTQTTADTLDYTGGELNRGSKLFVAVSGPPIRELPTEFDGDVKSKNPRIAFPGVVCIEENLVPNDFALQKFPLIVLVDDSAFATSTLRNFLWTAFTKSDPATDVSGVGEFTEHKHWGCTGPLVIDARRKPHHAPELEEPPEIAKRADEIVDRIL
jgi:4-hydroxy-3-polyprenylbenzoate decarboxylase